MMPISLLPPVTALLCPSACGEDIIIANYLTTKYSAVIVGRFAGPETISATMDLLDQSPKYDLCVLSFGPGFPEQVNGSLGQSGFNVLVERNSPENRISNNSAECPEVESSQLVIGALGETLDLGESTSNGSLIMRIGG